MTTSVEQYHRNQKKGSRHISLLSKEERAQIIAKRKAQIAQGINWSDGKAIIRAEHDISYNTLNTVLNAEASRIYQRKRYQRLKAAKVTAAAAGVPAAGSITVVYPEAAVASVAKAVERIQSDYRLNDVQFHAVLAHALGRYDQLTGAAYAKTLLAAAKR